ncbi:hypothetical protein HXX76_002155 [Chlamydomonas incerta]|uniref:ACT domain-containing protein n=1 Tax=Chlamydomonas incerta TaxID=51695 RepID=A0A836B0D4_CHLIN|nr:hypothetical protein HXX76_002155 [Chlamydomonas incerta]|eukprot:KAG2443812.1 hypothetical protein HXX76_002155 [Chlamydomonas incerta]
MSSFGARGVCALARARTDVAAIASAQRRPRQRLGVLVKAGEVSLPYPKPEANTLDLGTCNVAAVVVDNQSDPKFTILEIMAPDQPGLVRVLSWVLNGMQVRVHHGLLETNAEGMAHDKLWVTDFRNRKLKNSSADSLGARLEDFMIMCGPSEAEHQTSWICGAIEVSNEANPDFTQVIIRGEPTSHKPGYLLDLATALTSIGVSIQEAVIQGGPDVPAPELAIADRGYDFNKSGRVFKFLLKGPAGGKMTADSVASLIFTLRLLEGKGTMPTVAPNMDALLKLGDKCRN